MFRLDLSLRNRRQNVRHLESTHPCCVAPIFCARLYQCHYWSAGMTEVRPHEAASSYVPLPPVHMDVWAAMACDCSPSPGLKGLNFKIAWTTGTGTCM